MRFDRLDEPTKGAAMNFTFVPELRLGEALLALVGGFGLLSLYFAARQLKDARRAQQTQILLGLQQNFRSIRGFSTFLYRLDYSGPGAWTFDPRTFPASPEEKVLDAALYQFAFVGSLLAARDIDVADLGWLRSWARIVLGSPQVHAYLAWLKGPTQRPDHDGFGPAVLLYERLVGRDGGYARLAGYLR